MPVIKLETEFELQCGCVMELYKILLLVAFLTRYDEEFRCPQHDTRIDTCVHLREAAEIFLTFIENDDGRAVFPGVFLPCLSS